MIQLSGLTAIPRISNNSQPDAAELKRRARNELDSEQTYYSLIALPMCMSSVAWEFIDTVLDMCVILRIEPLKKVCRTIRQLKTDYDYHYRRHGLKNDAMKPLQSWCQNFLDTTNGGSDMFKPIKEAIVSRYPKLLPDWAATVASSYLALVYLKGVIKYTENEEVKFAKKLGIPNHGHMLPDELYKVIPLVETVVGDCVMDKDFLSPYIAEIVDMMTDVAQSATEPVERTNYRHKCIAFVCNGGCKAQAVNGSSYGCFPSSACKRMLEYDKKQESSMN